MFLVFCRSKCCQDHWFYNISENKTPVDAASVVGGAPFSSHSNFIFPLYYRIAAKVSWTPCGTQPGTTGFTIIDKSEPHIRTSCLGNKTPVNAASVVGGAPFSSHSNFILPLYYRISEKVPRELPGTFRNYAGRNRVYYP